jgi:hypothetical protein
VCITLHYLKNQYRRSIMYILYSWLGLRRECDDRFNVLLLTGYHTAFACNGKNHITILSNNKYPNHISICNRSAVTIFSVLINLTKMYEALLSVLLCANASRTCWAFKLFPASRRPTAAATRITSVPAQWDTLCNGTPDVFLNTTDVTTS